MCQVNSEAMEQNNIKHLDSMTARVYRVKWREVLNIGYNSTRLMNQQNVLFALDQELYPLSFIDFFQNLSPKF